MPCKHDMIYLSAFYDMIDFHVIPNWMHALGCMRLWFFLMRFVFIVSWVMGVCCVRGFINILTSAVMYFYVLALHAKNTGKMAHSAYGFRFTPRRENHEKMFNIYKWLMKKGSNLFSIEASSGCTALVFEVVIVATFNKALYFLFGWNH